MLFDRVRLSIHQSANLRTTPHDAFSDKVLYGLRDYASKRSYLHSNLTCIGDIEDMGRSRIALETIGYVRTKATEKDLRTHRGEILSEVVLNEEYANGLKGIEEYSHLFVLFWLHKVGKSERRDLLIHPKHREDLPEVGIFSTRQRNHPNPIGLTVVELVGRASNVLRVKNLDALDGTPVLDIKPYNQRDIAERIRVPDWWLRSQS